MGKTIISPAKTRKEAADKAPPVRSRTINDKQKRSSSCQTKFIIGGPAFFWWAADRLDTQAGRMPDRVHQPRLYHAAPLKRVPPENSKVDA